MRFSTPHGLSRILYELVSRVIQAGQVFLIDLKVFTQVF